MSKLRISDDLALPLDAVTQKFGILGRTGSGKSYCATKLCEEMLEAKAQVIALDPVGVWYGLRIPDKDAPKGFTGYTIPIFGGLHGDVPLEPGAGEFIANLIVDRGISAVLDVSQFESDAQKAQFAKAFATKFFFRKKSSPSPVHLFLEEAQEFVPQNPQRDEAMMLHAFHRVAKLGRNFGIGVTLISQRPQEVNKKALNQTECLLAFQMTGPQERKTIETWIAEKGVNEDIREILPHLKVGECHVWSPQWLQVNKTIKIAKKKTADVSSTPVAGKKQAEPKELSDADLSELALQMAATIEKAKQEDPRELRKQIAELNKEIGSLRHSNALLHHAGVETKVEKKEVSILREAHVNRLESAAKKIVDAAAAGDKFARELLAVIRESKFANTEPRPVSPSPAVAKQVGASKGLERDGYKPLMRNRTAREAPSPIGSTAGDTFLDGELKITATQQRILDALAWFESIGNYSPSTKQVGAVALIDAGGGYFGNVTSPLSAHELITRDSGVVSLTDKGRQLARIPENISTLRDYHEMLSRRVRQAKKASGKTVEVLNAIINRGGEPITAAEIGKEVSIDHTGGYFGNVITPLSTLGLIRRDRGIVYPTEILFPPIPS